MIDDLTLAGLCARRAADIVASGFEGVTSTEFKGSVDPVTAVDRAAETAIRSLLATHRPDDAILGEEEGGARWEADRVWIVDPLDGTVNFVHGIPHVAVSVALWDRGRPLVGVVHDVLRDEVFAASAGGGATIGSGEPGTRRLQVSTTAGLTRALVATGFPYDRQEHAGELGATVGRVLARVQGIRRMGSAALDLCWVAAGRYEAYWEYRLQPWDTAAGQLVVEEAGGRVSDLAGRPYRPDATAVLASNGHVHDDLARILGEGE
ncbi:MAG TPA: inositol monophosphatase family protein [Acidimicrobiia bacterium]|nr:inositol monophosphatase family protein [Acidimicrobiia bacterium]